MQKVGFSKSYHFLIETISLHKQGIKFRMRDNNVSQLLSFRLRDSVVKVLDDQIYHSVLDFFLHYEDFLLILQQAKIDIFKVNLGLVLKVRLEIERLGHGVDHGLPICF